MMLYANVLYGLYTFRKTNIIPLPGTVASNIGAMQEPDADCQRRMEKLEPCRVSSLEIALYGTGKKHWSCIALHGSRTFSSCILVNIPMKPGVTGF